MDLGEPIVWDMRNRSADSSAAKAVPFGPDDVASGATFVRSLLAKHGLSEHPASWLRKALANAEATFPDLVREHRCSGGAPCAHLKETVRTHQKAADVILIARCLMWADGHLPAATMKERLRRLCGGDHSITTVAAQSNQRDLVFELICASWMCRFSESVDLVDPPDVLCRMDEAWWGVACKSAYGNAATAADAIRYGAEQLQRSTADAGIVCVRITDVFPHDQLPTVPTAERPTIGSFVRVEDAELVIGALARPFMADAVAHLHGGLPALAARFPKVKALTFVGHTLISLHRDGQAHLGLAPVKAVASVTPMIPSFVRNFMDAMNW
jgi:hypothetical protein